MFEVYYVKLDKVMEYMSLSLLIGSLIDGWMLNNRLGLCSLFPYTQQLVVFRQVGLSSNGRGYCALFVCSFSG